MAQNKVRRGKTLDYTPDSAVKGGEVAVAGSLVGVVESDIAAEATGVLNIAEVYALPKANEEITQGTKVYWDADGDPVGGTAGTGAITATSTDNTLAGTATDDAASGAATVNVLLNVG